MGKANDNTGNGWDDFWAGMWNKTFAGRDRQFDAINKQAAATIEEEYARRKAINDKQNADAAAATAAANTENVAKNAAYESARNAGAGKAGAQALSGLTEDSTASNTANVNSALRSGRVQSQNDYLTKMGYAKGLDQQASNLEAGSFLNTLGAIFGGAGSGAGVGASIGGSGK